MFIKIKNEVFNIKKEDIISYRIIEKKSSHNNDSYIASIQPSYGYVQLQIIIECKDKTYKSMPIDDYEKANKIFENLNEILGVIDIENIDPKIYNRKEKLKKLDEK